MTTVTVDGVEVTVSEGGTILDAATPGRLLGPDAVLRRAPGAVRGLPCLHGRRRGLGQAAARLHHAVP